MPRPTAPYGRRCQSYSFFLGGPLSCGRRHRGRRSSASTFCCYIAAVVFLQNALVAYNVARRASLDVLATNHGTVANWTTSRPRLDTTSAAHPHVLAPSARQIQPAAIKSSSYQATGFGDQLRFEMNENNERTYYRKRLTKVNPYRQQLLLVPTHLCDASTAMVILVHSGTQNVAQRAAIRETWGDAAATGRWPNEQQNGSCAGLRLAFVLGLQKNEAVNSAVRQEYDRHDDIVQGDFIDHYHNMTLKSLLDLKVVDERCPGVRYLLKTDDDMIINLPYLLLLLTNKKLQRSIMGPVNVGSRVHRSGKWKVTKDEFPFAFYPPYESGSAYVITGDLIHELFVTAEYVPPIFVDDVYVTGILGRVLGVNHVMHRGFAFWHSRPPSACDIVLNRVVAGTKMTPTLLRNVWKQLENAKCPVSYTTFIRMFLAQKLSHN